MFACPNAKNQLPVRPQKRSTVEDWDAGPVESIIKPTGRPACHRPVSVFSRSANPGRKRYCSVLASLSGAEPIGKLPLLPN